FAGKVLVPVANQVVALSPDTFLVATGSEPPSAGTMTPDIREQALSGLQTGAQPVSAGQAGAKDQALGSTVTTLADALPSVRTPLVVNPLTLPTPPMRVNVPLLPGGVREFPVIRGGGGCGVPICVD